MLASLRSRLLLIVFLASLPAVGFIVLASMEHRQFAEKVARQDLLQKVHAIAEHQGRVIVEAEQTLTLLAEIPAIRQASAGSAEILTNLVKQNPEYANLGIADQQGNVLCSVTPLGQPENIAQQFYFFQALQARRLAVGSYQMNRISRKATLGLGHPLLDNTGKLTGVLFAALDLSWLQSLTDTYHFLPEESLTVIDRNGTVLARVPDTERFVGRRHTDVDIIQTVLTQVEGTAEVRGLDGELKMYAFVPLAPAVGMGYVYAGIPTQVFLAPVRQHLVSHLLWLGLIVAGGLAVTWLLSSRLILDRLQRLILTTEKLASGDLAARTGIPYGKGELDLLARHFDGMAEDLERRKRRLQAINHLLAGATRTASVQDYLQAAVGEIAQFSRCAAVGIRILRQDESIPYEALQGFSPDFSATKTPLSLQSDYAMCVRVVKGDTDPELPFFTEGGSFYVNALSQFLVGVSPEEQGWTCKACHEAGYESVALVPLRLGQRILGLIHVADPQENMVPGWLVEDLETLSLRLGPALEGLWAQENIRILSHELIRLQEKARQNLARELHDSLAQDLAAMKIELDTLAHDLAGQATESLAPRIALRAERVQGFIALVRDLAYDLRPPLLDQLGLVRAIQTYCQEFSQRTGIQVDFLAAGIDEAGLDTATATTLFRLVQEGLTNVRKHAQANQVTVRLVASHPKLLLRLEDDGRGFDVEESKLAAGADRRLGLIGMQERVALLGGSMRLESRPDQGTVITVEIPWEGAEHDQA